MAFMYKSYNLKRCVLTVASGDGGCILYLHCQLKKAVPLPAEQPSIVFVLEPSFGGQGGYQISFLPSSLSP